MSPFFLGKGFLDAHCCDAPCPNAKSFDVIRLGFMYLKGHNRQHTGDNQIDGGSGADTLKEL